MLNAIRQQLHQRLDRAVKDATPEGVARRPGESVPVWSLQDPEHRSLGAEIDGCYGNGLGGVDRQEIGAFKAAMAEQISAQRVLLAGCRPGSTAHRDVLATIHRWEQLVIKAEQIDEIVRQSDLRLLNDVAGMVQRQGSGLFKAFAAMVTEGAGQVASRVQLNLNAEVGGKR